MSVNAQSEPAEAAVTPLLPGLEPRKLLLTPLLVRVLALVAVMLLAHMY